MAGVGAAEGRPGGDVVIVPGETGTETVCKGGDSGLMNVTVAEASSMPVVISGVLSAYVSRIRLRFWFTLIE
jgi:hypothetical protein